MAATVVSVKASIPGACKTFKLYDPASAGTALSTGANAITLTGFSPMDLTAPLWQASTDYNIGNLVTDGNGNIQRCTTAGTSGATAPTWATSSTTSDNSVTWTFYAAYRAPQFGNTIPDPYQVRLRPFCDSGLSPANTASAVLDAGSWYLSLTDTTQTSIVCTIYCGAATSVVIIEVPAE